MSSIYANLQGLGNATGSLPGCRRLFGLALGRPIRGLPGMALNRDQQQKQFGQPPPPSPANRAGHDTAEDKDERRHPLLSPGSPTAEPDGEASDRRDGTREEAEQGE